MKTSDKKTESQEAIELLHMEIDEQDSIDKKAAFIVKQATAIKKAYVSRLNEVSAEIATEAPKTPKDANVDEMIASNEARKLREYQHEVKLHSIDQFERQIKMGSVKDWQQSLVDIFNNMNAVICGSTLAI